jgi:hypothetical protein
MLGVVQRQVNEIREVVLVAKQRLGKRLGCPEHNGFVRRAGRDSRLPAALRTVNLLQPTRS